MDKLDIKDGVIIMASAENKDNVPKAFFKTNRFDHVLNLSTPDHSGRVQMLSHFLSKISHNDRVDLDILARITEHESPKKMKYILNRAAMKSAMEYNSPISMDTIESVMLEMDKGPEIKRATKDKDYEKIVAYHEAGHTLVCYYSKYTWPVFKVTIIRRGRAEGVTSWLPDKDNCVHSKNYYLADIDVCFGGRVAEEILLGADGVTNGKSTLHIIFR